MAFAIFCFRNAVDNIQPYPESAKADSEDKKDKVAEVALKGNEIHSIIRQVMTIDIYRDA